MTANPRAPRDGARVIPENRSTTLSHIAFLNIPGHGHVNPTLPVVAELVARGHRVGYAVDDTFAAAVERAGATPVRYETTLPAADQVWPTDLAPAMHLFLAEAKAVLPQLTAAFADDRPDLVVYDIGAWTARLLAQRWGVPAIQFSPTFVTYEGWEEQMGEVYSQPDVLDFFDQLDAWLREQGSAVDGRTYVGHPERAVVSIPRSFQINGDTVDPKYTFVGPCLDRRAHEGDWEAPGSAPVLLISLGSAYTDRPEFYRRCLEAFGGTRWHVVMGIGKHVSPADLGPVPANVELHAWVPQQAVLAKASAFITHCGMGGTMEGLHHGVPMVGVPTLGEQHMNAARLEELGVGRYLPHPEATPERLRAAVTELVSDPAVATRLAELQREIRAAGGTRAAADVIESLL
ncbi:macrolide family glycosyltransferase [Saccharothrix coeruleofusca]|uniref:macrolide family glycosyltransferase n=1 Tax=Saccharothrix coeruleofusca TaxID=33919 RepID=UPI00357135BC